MMSGLASALTNLIPAIGLSLIHFLWQGALIAIVWRLVLATCRGPRARHNWSLVALSAMVAAPLVTFWMLTNNSQPPALAAAPSLFETAPGPVWTWVVVAAWAAGASMLGLRAIVGFSLVERMRRRAEPLPEIWASKCRALTRRAALPLRVAFAQSRQIAGPAVVGLFRPIVLIPAAALTGVPTEQLEALILHELAHVRRLDAFANLFQTLVETLLFYHPAIWWVSRTIRVEREHCCDDIVVAEIGDPIVYVRALHNLAQLPSMPAAALAATGASLVQRVRRLLGVGTPARKFDSRALAASFVVLIAITLGRSAHVEAKAERKPAGVAAFAEPERGFGRSHLRDGEKGEPGIEAMTESLAAVETDAAGQPRDRGARRARSPDAGSAAPGYEARLAGDRAAAGRYGTVLGSYRAAPDHGADDSAMDAWNHRIDEANREVGTANAKLGAANLGSARPRLAASRPAPAPDDGRSSGPPDFVAPAHGGSTSIRTISTGQAPREVGVTIGAVRHEGPALRVNPKFRIDRATSNSLFMVDGHRSSQAAVAAIPPDRIAGISFAVGGSAKALDRGAAPQQKVVNVVTKPPS